MLIIQKLISNFFLSPMFFIAFLIFLAIFFYEFKKSTIRKIVLFLAIISYFLSIEPVKDLFVKRLENKYSPISESNLRNGDFYILLGAGIYDNAPSSLGRKGIPSEIATGRLVEVARLYHKYPKKIIVSGGIVISGNISESKVYKNYLEDLGVKSEDIIEENRSRTTEENAKYSMEIAKNMNFKKGILVTSATHMPRAKRTFDKFGLEIVAAPTAYLSGYKDYDFMSFMPRYSNLEIIYRTIWEYIGALYYKMRGV